MNSTLNMSANRNDVKWMYDGPDSSINTEEYLTGRKIDKAFDKHAESSSKSDVSKIDAVASKVSTNVDLTKSVLDLETVKKEDPLVAIKVKEEQIRREIFENPVKMKRLQKIVMAAMYKKMKKMAKKGEFPDFLKNYFDSQKDNRLSSESSDDKTDSENDHDTRTRRRMPSSDSVDSSDERRKAKRQKFGLVHLKGPDETYSSRKFYDASNSRHESISNEKKNAPSKQQPKKSLTEKEKEARRREMMDNAKWREEQRSFNQKQFREKEQEEEKKRAKEENSGAQFLKPMIAKAMNSRSVEERIRSKKQSIQRRHDAMDSNFVKK